MCGSRSVSQPLLSAGNYAENCIRIRNVAHIEWQLWRNIKNQTEQDKSGQANPLINHHSFGGCHLLSANRLVYGVERERELFALAQTFSFSKSVCLRCFFVHCSLPARSEGRNSEIVTVNVWPWMLTRRRCRRGASSRHRWIGVTFFFKSCRATARRSSHNANSGK